jgi:uncharacterized membrane protein YdjX (TVP38/TMEM64 family)
MSQAPLFAPLLLISPYVRFSVFTFLAAQKFGFGGAVGLTLLGHTIGFIIPYAFGRFMCTRCCSKQLNSRESNNARTMTAALNIVRRQPLAIIAIRFSKAIPNGWFNYLCGAMQLHSFLLYVTYSAAGFAPYWCLWAYLGTSITEEGEVGEFLKGRRISYTIPEWTFFMSALATAGYCWLYMYKQIKEELVVMAAAPHDLESVNVTAVHAI